MARRCPWWIVAVAAVCCAQKYNLGPHDIDGRGCAGCHIVSTSSQGRAVAAWGIPPSPEMLYGTYRGKSTGRIEEIGGAPPEAGEGRLHSYQCLSCHDGSLAQAMDIGKSKARTSRLGLEGSHPVNVEYNARGAGLFRVMPTVGDRWKLVNNPENPGTRLVLFNRSKSDATPTVQCATCHDPHNHDNPYFLRDQYDEYSLGTRFCRTCHAEQSAMGMFAPR